MKIGVRGSEPVFDELKKNTSSEIEWLRTEDLQDIVTFQPDALFDFSKNAAKVEYPDSIPVIFIDSVNDTLEECIQKKNIIRINGWKGFLQRPKWEIAGSITTTAEKVLRALGKTHIVVADVPGFVSARILSMIINEAFFAKQENVSTNSEIDIAMKLGTNYPKGPFEWAEEIGLQNICSLLKKLKTTDNRYTPAELLVNSCAE